MHKLFEGGNLWQKWRHYDGKKDLKEADMITTSI